MMVPRRIEVQLEQDILSLLNVTAETQDWTAQELEDLAAEQRSQSNQHEVSMKELQQLRETTFPRWAETHATWMTWSTALVLTLLLVSGILGTAYWIIKSQHHRRQLWRQWRQDEQAGQAREARLLQLQLQLENLGGLREA